MRNEIKHGEQAGVTPDFQSQEFIQQKLKEERSISVALAPHHDYLQMCVARTIKSSFSDIPTDLIELGTGTGATTEYVLREIPVVKIKGVDSSKKRLGRANSRLSDHLDRVDLINQDFREFAKGIPEQSLDCVFSAFTLHNLPLEQRREILNLVASRLKSGGIFIDADKHGYEDLKVNQILFEQQLSLIHNNFADNPELGDLWAQHYQEDLEMDEPRESYKRYLEEIGFEVRFVLQYGLEAVVKAKKL